MEPNTDRKKEQREITYQVGWKKGKIAFQEEKAQDSEALPLSSSTAAGSTLDSRLQALWKPAPALPAGLLLPLLYALPVVIFIITLILVYGLRLVSWQ